MAEDAWNARDPERVALADSPDSEWRNRVEFLRGREEIKAFLRRKWAKELDYGPEGDSLGLPRKPHSGELRIRVARRGGAVVSLLWE